MNRVDRGPLLLIVAGVLLLLAVVAYLISEAEDRFQRREAALRDRQALRAQAQRSIAALKALRGGERSDRQGQGRTPWPARGDPQVPEADREACWNSGTGRTRPLMAGIPRARRRRSRPRRHLTAVREDLDRHPLREARRARGRSRCHRASPRTVRPSLVRDPVCRRGFLMTPSIEVIEHESARIAARADQRVQDVLLRDPGRRLGSGDDPHQELWLAASPRSSRP